MSSSIVTTASQGNAMVCIAWIDGAYLTRECVTQAIASAKGLFAIVSFESVYECIKTARRKIDLIVYHSHETDSVNVADIASLREAFAPTQLVILSDATKLEPALVKDVLTRGASGFILTSQTGLKMMISVLALVASGGTFVPKEFLFSYVDEEQPGPKGKPPRPADLSPRQLEVLKLVKEGKPNKIIAYELGMSAGTVKVHVRNVMRKLGCTNRTHAAMIADKHLQA